MRHREKGDQGHCGVLYYRCNRATTVGGDWEYFKASFSGSCLPTAHEKRNCSEESKTTVVLVANKTVNNI